MDEQKAAREMVKRMALITAYVSFGNFLTRYRNATDIPYLDESSRSFLLWMDLRTLEVLVNNLSERILASRIASE